MLAYIRAIYLPLAWSASKDHPELCSFVQASFALGRTVNLWRYGDRFEGLEGLKTDKALGTDVEPGYTLGVDVTGLVSLLALPRQFRKDNVSICETRAPPPPGILLTL